MVIRPAISCESQPSSPISAVAHFGIRHSVIGHFPIALLLTWTAWQVGNGYCTTIADALAHLRSCPQGNDPLEFIFGDLLARFTPEEERIVATLSYPTEPIPVTAIAEISGVDEPTTHRALKLLTNRSIVVPQEGEEKYALVPMVAEFIRHVRREVVGQLGAQLADRA